MITGARKEHRLAHPVLDLEERGIMGKGRDLDTVAECNREQHGDKTDVAET